MTGATASPARDVFRGPLSDALGADAAALLVPADRALPVPSASDRAAWAAVAAAHTTVDRILAAAAEEHGTPWPQPLASAAVRYHRDGDRSAWEDAAFARQRRLSRAVVAAAVTLDDARIDDVADGITLLCEQSSWCWPAHDDSFERHGSVVPVADDPYLDLGAGEAVAQLAWADHVLGQALDERYPGLRARIRYEASRRVFEPFLHRRDWWWIGHERTPINWNAWIHANVLAAALRLLDGPDDAELRSRVVSTAVADLDRFVAVLPADGAIDEGYGYWWEGALRALEALDLLRYATDGKVDAYAAGIPALRATVAYPHSMQLGDEWFVNVADGRAKPPSGLPWSALHRAARRFGDAGAEAFAASHRVPGTPAATEEQGLGRLLRALTDPAWMGAARAAAPLPRDIWLPSVELTVVRESGGTARGLALAAKGGHNGESHNHNDVGSFIVAVDGVPVVVDAGRPTYTAQTFGPDRYDIWTMQSSWHSVPEVRGIPQSPGTEFAARAVRPHDGGLALDLAGAYDVPGLRRWHRRIRLDRGPRSRVVVDDAWELDAWTGAEPEPETTVRMLLAGGVRLIDGAAHVTALEDARPLVVRWPSDIPARTTELELGDPLLTSVWGPRLTRLDLVVTDRRSLSVTVELFTSTPEELR
ncbi:heparinase II/III domain-containing protein [Microbacterium rhizosphaerae]|uniref:Heparinase II/III family protein n=1 Tax=Microbacterium rhizosphaerae TaxID=1678237 RepID=A0ABZ0SM80_9MICO|nr:heparinase II/III family protein [Microbacterium rhizosphaerae]WPR90479.1 heparinase II/III family protein [Microbacterium rhizosphaerae]